MIPTRLSPGRMPPSVAWGRGGQVLASPQVKGWEPAAGTAPARGAGRLADALEEDLAVAAACDVAAVVGADLARDHAWWLGPHRRPGMRRVVLLEERLPNRNTNLLTKQERGRALPTRGGKVRGEGREARVAGRP